MPSEYSFCFFSFQLAKDDASYTFVLQEMGSQTQVQYVSSVQRRDGLRGVMVPDGQTGSRSGR